jgi:hypothetical protein
MFGADWSDPQTLWLNLTNLVLGLFTLGALATMVVAIVRELFAKRRKTAEVSVPSAARRPGAGRLFLLPDVGVTMADGGEPMAKTPENLKLPAEKPKCKVRRRCSR